MLRFIGVAVAGLLAVNPYLAVAGENPQAGQIFLSGVGAMIDEPDDYDIGTVGVGIGYAFTDSLAGEVSYLGWDGDGDTLWFTAFRSLGQAGNRVQPMVLLGGGRTKYDTDGMESDNRAQYFAGFGAFGGLGERLSWRADLRAVQTDGDGVKPFGQLGITVFLGDVSPAPVRRDEPSVPVWPQPEEEDKCPDVPAGVPVDEDGCPLPLDSDGDGVLDDKDRCPDTQAGAVVGEDGCYVHPDEPITFTIVFDTDESVIRADQERTLRQGLEMLRKYPITDAVIEGHADWRASQAHNLPLSERRAESVRDYLVARGIDPDRLTTVGYGELNPVADNTTPEGQQQNRRVTTITVQVRQD